jgi:hypothetical protein
MLKIRGLDQLQKELQEAEQALSELGGEIDSMGSSANLRSSVSREWSVSTLIGQPRTSIYIQGLKMHKTNYFQSRINFLYLIIIKLCAFLFPALAIFFLSSVTARADINVQPVSFMANEAVKVKANDFIYYQVNLNAKDRFNVDLEILNNNAIKAWFVDDLNFQKFLNGKRFDYITSLSGDVLGESKGSFISPNTSKYFFILDNRGALVLSRNIVLKLYKEHLYHTPESKGLERFYNETYSALKKTFIFKDFNIEIRLCGTENAFSNPNIILCWELIDRLKREGKPLANHYVAFHEIGHSLLNIWGYPTYDNEDVADEFATFLSVMIGADQLAYQAAQYWMEKPASTNEAIAKLYINDRHTLSPQRARNILGWLENKEKLLDRWITILAPRMTDEALKGLLIGGPFTNLGPIMNELQNRGFDVE